MKRLQLLRRHPYVSARLALIRMHLVHAARELQPTDFMRRAVRTRRHLRRWLRERAHRRSDTANVVPCLTFLQLTAGSRASCGADYQQ